MQVIRDAPTKSAKRTLKLTGDSPRGDHTQAMQGANTPLLHRPDTELVVFPRRVMTPPTRPWRAPALAYLNRHDLNHNAPTITMHATMTTSPVGAYDPRCLLDRWLINAQCGFPIRPASITLSARLFAPRNRALPNAYWRPKALQQRLSCAHGRRDRPADARARHRNRCWISSRRDAVGRSQFGADTQDTTTATAQ